MTAATVVMAAVVLLLGGAVLVFPVCRNRLLAGRVSFGITGLASLLAMGAAVISSPATVQRTPSSISDQVARWCTFAMARPIRTTTKAIWTIVRTNVRPRTPAYSSWSVRDKAGTRRGDEAKPVPWMGPIRRS